MRTTPLYHNNLQKYQRDHIKLPALFNSAGCTRFIFIISAWTGECMPLHFWVLNGICSSYWRYSLHLKWQRRLVVSLKNLLYTDLCIVNDMFSVLVFTFYEWYLICIKLLIFLIIKPDDPPSVFILLCQSKVGDVLNEKRTECKYGQQCYQMMRFCFFQWIINKRNGHVLKIMHHD